MTKLGSRKLHIVQKWLRWGLWIRHKIDYNGLGALKGAPPHISRDSYTVYVNKKNWNFSRRIRTGCSWSDDFEYKCKLSSTHWTEEQFESEHRKLSFKLNIEFCYTSLTPLTPISKDKFSIHFLEELVKRICLYIKAFPIRPGLFKRWIALSIG